MPAVTPSKLYLSTQILRTASPTALCNLYSPAFVKASEVSRLQLVLGRSQRRRAYYTGYPRTKRAAGKFGKKPIVEWDRGREGAAFSLL